MTPSLKKIAKFLQIAKFSPIFKQPSVLPRKPPNFGKTYSHAFFLFFVFVFFSCHDMQDLSGLNFIGKKIFVRSSSLACDNRIFLVHEFERRFYSNVHESFPGSGFTGSNLENASLKEKFSFRCKY